MQRNWSSPAARRITIFFRIMAESLIKKLITYVSLLRILFLKLIALLYRSTSIWYCRLPLIICRANHFLLDSKTKHRGGNDHWLATTEVGDERLERTCRSFEGKDVNISCHYISYRRNRLHERLIPPNEMISHRLLITFT